MSVTQRLKSTSSLANYRWTRSFQNNISESSLQGSLMQLTYHKLVHVDMKSTTIGISCLQTNTFEWGNRQKARVDTFWKLLGQSRSITANASTIRGSTVSIAHRSLFIQLIDKASRKHGGRKLRFSCNFSGKLGWNQSVG